METEPTYFQVPTERIALLRRAAVIFNLQLEAGGLPPLQVRHVLSPDLPEGQSEIVLYSDAGILDFDAGRMVLAALNRISREQLQPQAN